MGNLDARTEVQKTESESGDGGRGRGRGRTDSGLGDDRPLGRYR